MLDAARRQCLVVRFVATLVGVAVQLNLDVRVG